MKQVKFRIVQTILPLLIGMFLSLGAYAQQITVKGHVKDAMGEPKSILKEIKGYSNMN